ncbi:MAG TPA: mechanosensitive ion channel family protein [Solirubrobacterales bacterium]|nr:mechanosensitive ion channel family protein [Solirubrobacterales bacterium]
MIRRRPRRPQNLFESRTEVWRQVGLGEQVDRAQAQRARGGAIFIALLIIAVLLAFDHRRELFSGGGTTVRAVTVIALVVLGWALAHQLARAFAPSLFGRMDPGTAGTVGFTIRLVTVVGMVIVALQVAGLDTRALAVGGAFTAVVLGPAAQQTLGNLFAGLVLLSTRPFRVGERVRLTGGALAGSIEGIVGSLGLFYTTLVSGADRTMVPNSVILQLAVVPLREPERVEMRARFDASMSPSEVERRLASAISVPTRYPPDITLEELDRDEVVVRIAATPLRPADGAQLAAEVLAAVRESDADGTANVDGNGGRPAA